MNRKKLSSLILACSIMSSIAMPVFAATSSDNSNIDLISESAVNKISSTEDANVKISKDAAIVKGRKILKEYFNIIVNESDFKCNITLTPSNENKSYIWNISWNKNPFKKSSNINISLDGNTGKLISMNKNDYDKNNRQGIPNLSIEEAQKIADKTLQKINPKEFKNSILVRNRWYSNRYNSSNYNFNYVRLENGATFDSNNIFINIDGISGEVTAYTYNWDDTINLPVMKNLLSVEEAKNIFENNTTMSLKYKLFQNKYEYENAGNKKNIKLVYEPALKDSSVINAKTGEFINNNIDSNIKIDTVELNKNEKEAFYKKYASPKVSKDPLTEKEALNTITTTIANLYGEGYTISDLRYLENDKSSKGDSTKTWTAYFNKKLEVKDDKGTIKSTVVRDGSISINALNGQILYLYNYSPYNSKEDFTPKFTWKEGYYKAIDILGKYYKDKVKNIELTLCHAELLNPENANTKEPERIYTYSFIRKVNDIPYDNNNITISYNAETGEVSNMNLSWEDNLTFPSLNSNIGDNKAKKNYFSKYTPLLKYVLINTDDKSNSSKGELKLTYTYENNNTLVDAFTGKLLSIYDGEEIKFDIIEFLEEIKGSRAEKEITILAYKGLLDTENFQLKKEATYIDLIKLLVDAIGYTPYIIDTGDANSSQDTSKEESSESPNRVILSNEDYVAMAKYYGIIDGNLDSLHTESKVSREEMCKALIKFLQYEKIAESSNIFKLNCEDSKEVNKSNYGYVALAQGLNLIELEDNKLRPKESATIEELALGLFRALQSRPVNNDYYPMYK